MTKLDTVFGVSPTVQGYEGFTGSSRLCLGLLIVLCSNCHVNQFCSKVCNRIWVIKSEIASRVSPAVSGYVR
jgi:hypothetical protein